MDPPLCMGFRIPKTEYKCCVYVNMYEVLTLFFFQQILFFFNMDYVLKSPLNLLRYRFYVFWFFGHEACRVLAPCAYLCAKLFHSRFYEL